MKRLLVLMLVLGLASMADAVSVVIDDYRTATIYNADGTEWDGSPICVNTDLLIEWYSTSTEFEYWVGGVFIETGTLDYGTLYNAKAYYIAGELARAIYFEAPEYKGYGLVADGFDQSPGVWFEVWFHCDAIGTAEIGFYNDYGGDVYVDSVFIEQVPEPTTVLLLGLGGLLMRRRR